MEKVRQILQTKFQMSDWVIARPEDGQQKNGYVAQSDAYTVFIKFDVPVAVLQRLGEIEVAPRVLASGIAAGRAYVIQEYIAGRYPDWQWFADHLSLMATFFKRFHDDQKLATLLSRNATTDYHEHVASEVVQLETRFRSLDTDVLHTPAIISAFEGLKAQSKRLQPVDLVPIHADPNTKNMLLTGSKLLMVDWGDVQLSDPMRDVGLWLWWYVAKEQWHDFFVDFGQQMEDCLVDRIFWWAARTSFAIALWHVEHSYDCTAFLKDFVAALNKEDNPHF